jgi:hypothetical protein
VLHSTMELMRLRSVLLALMIGAGLFLPTQIPAQAKTHFKASRGKKSKKFKHKKLKAHRVKRKAANNVRR